MEVIVKLDKIYDPNPVKSDFNYDRIMFAVKLKHEDFIKKPFYDIIIK